MKPINIYILTRIENTEAMQRLERQLSKRKRHLKIKEWETRGLKLLCDKLCSINEEVSSYDFFYSFAMPKLGKEFDLLRINEDYVVNIELKSGNVTDEMVKQQLRKNRYYLSSLERNIYSYTYISEDNRLVRLSGGGRLIEADMEELVAVLEQQKLCYKGDIEELFKEDKFLISPLTDPGRFLRREYFLTSGQRDIRKQILKDILIKPGHIKKQFSVHGFTGLPGTGKTILLYDIAMQLSVSEKVCVLHFGSYEKGLEQLNERLKRVDFYYCD
ncbi:MAG: ATP-binding protein, partial [Lachnospiraceae bacterium]|nr:ATP-binding protein [Lachnospiraceae bacterium]